MRTGRWRWIFGLLLAAAACNESSGTVPADSRLPDAAARDADAGPGADRGADAPPDLAAWDAPKPDAPPDPTGTIWITRAGGGESESGFGVVIDKSDSVYVSGMFQGTAHFGLLSLTSKGKDDAFIAKLDSTGKFVWAVGGGGTELDTGRGLALDSAGELLAVGTFTKASVTLGAATGSCTRARCPFIARLDPATGKVLSLNVISTVDASAYDIAVDAKDSRYVAASFDGSGTLGTAALTSKGSHDALVFKADANNKLQWALAGGGSGHDSADYVVAGPSGVLVTAQFDGPSSFGGHALPSKAPYVASVDPAGKLSWITQVASAAIWAALAADAKGNARVAGHFFNSVAVGSSSLTSKGSADVLLGAFSSAGSPLWGASGGGGDYDGAYGVAIDAKGQTYLTGYFKTAATFGGFSLKGVASNDVFVARLDPQGSFKSVVAALGVGNNTPMGIALDSSGAQVVVGSFQSDMTCGPHKVSSAGQWDVFVWKLKPP